MKKYLFLILIFILNSKAFCQDSKISIGMVFSPPFTLENSSKILSTNEIRYNYSAGLSADYKFNSLISLKTVIFYERKFIKKEIFGPDERNIPIHLGDISFDYDYLILPVMGSFNSQGKITLHFDAGPYFGYLINQKTVISSLYIIPIQQVEGKGIRKQYDFGVTIASGVSFPISNRILFDLGFQANFGLINLSKNPDADNGTVKTNSIGLLFGLKYKL